VHHKQEERHMSMIDLHLPTGVVPATALAAIRGG
jgi:hypothetical protein